MFIAMHCAVFPTCVGMNRFSISSLQVIESVPHMRGDEPGIDGFWVACHQCSPHAWG